MAEALAFFGLAGNILQFLDFGSKVILRFRDYYRSTRDSNDLVPDARLLTKDLHRIVRGLEQEAGQPNAQHVPFKHLAKECGTVANDLLKTLDSLSSARRDRLSALRTAWSARWKEEDIARLQHRLDQFRSQLILQLLEASREQIRSSENHQAALMLEIRARLEDVHHDVKTQASKDDNLGSHIVDMVVSKLALADRAKQKTALKDALIQNLLTKNNQEATSNSTPPVLPIEKHQQISRAILSQLRFDSMVTREENIDQAHAATFKWIFDKSINIPDKWSSLPVWLASSHPIYWVTGKAGSGKSTLMKHVSNTLDSQLRGTSGSDDDNYLRMWAPEPLKLIRASFFFWNSGAEVQMSQSGLLRSLIHQILTQAPSLLPLVFPKQWEAMCLYGSNNIEGWDWSETDLISTTNEIVAKMDQDTRLCLFIDGLDEFNGDHLNLVMLLKNLSNDPRIKICVSSRPWDMFEKTFEQDPSLRMERLTHDDIVAYTSARFSSSSDFSQLQAHDTQYARSLIENIVTKADGVFLWVKLVVTSLLSGIRDGDRIEDLQSRLSKLPPDLEKLYDNMLDNIDRGNVEHTSQLFTIVSSFEDPMTVTLLSFIDDESYQSVLNRPVGPLTAREMTYRFEQMRRRLSSRTMGLLELNMATKHSIHSSRLTVQYLHKTVYDYLQRSRVKIRLGNALQSSFDVNLRICIGLLASLKTNGTGIQSVDDLLGTMSSRMGFTTQCITFWRSTANFMHHASRIKPENHARAIKIIDAWDETTKKILYGNASNGYQHYVQLHPAFYDSKAFPQNFLGLSIMYGLTYYVESRSTKSCLVRSADSTYPLLADSVIFRTISSYHSKRLPIIYRFPQPNTVMLELLLNLGARVDIAPCSEALSYDPAVIVARQLLSLKGKRFRRNELLVWRDMVQLLISRHDEIWSPKLFGSWEKESKATYHDDLRLKADNFCPEDDAKMTVRGMLRILWSLRDSKKNIHRARLAMLTNINNTIEACTTDESQRRVVWLPKIGASRLTKLFSIFDGTDEIIVEEELEYVSVREGDNKKVIVIEEPEVRARSRRKTRSRSYRRDVDPYDDRDRDRSRDR